MNLDIYFLRARAAPAALLFAPIGALLGALGLSTYAAGGLALGTTAAFSLIAAGYVADRGRKAQDALFASWGGTPTTQRLKHAHGDVAAASRRAELLAMTGVPLPTAGDEQTRPAEVARAYDHAVEMARATLRENDSHRILADINAEFGLRRNCFGVRREGLGVALVTLVVGLLLWIASVGTDPAKYLGVAALAAAIALFWWRFVREPWVRSAAERYADQFFQTLHTYSRPHDPN